LDGAGPLLLREAVTGGRLREDRGVVERTLGGVEEAVVLVSGFDASAAVAESGVGWLDGEGSITGSLMLAPTEFTRRVPLLAERLIEEVSVSSSFSATGIPPLNGAKAPPNRIRYRPSSSFGLRASILRIITSSARM